MTDQEILREADKIKALAAIEKRRIWQREHWRKKQAAKKANTQHMCGDPLQAADYVIVDPTTVHLPLSQHKYQCGRCGQTIRIVKL